MVARQLLFKQPSGPAIPVHCDLQVPREQPQHRVLHQHPTRTDVLIELTPDGPDYHLICQRHQYAAPPVTRDGDLGVCPECLAEVDAAPGRRRYAALQQVEIRTGLR